METRATRVLRWTLAPAVWLALVPAAGAATIYAAGNGLDGPNCGASATPCRSITRAMAKATDGDTIQVLPGRYGADLNSNGISGEPGEEVPSFGGMLTIAKPLILISTDGAAATVDATQNFWGAATGRGSAPANAVCNSGRGTATSTPFATTPFAINPTFDP
jgi:uncharacterized protein DUF1565